MTTPNSRCFSLGSLLLILIHMIISGKAAIIQHQLSSQVEPKHQAELQDNKTQPLQQHRHESLPSKMLILTTGDQIKLYSFVEQSDELSNDYYLIKPLPFKGYGDRYDSLRYDKNYTFHYWNVHKETKRIASLLNKEKQKKKSILPETQADDEEYDLDHEGRLWKKPNIVDVDYFFNSYFCSITKDKYGRGKMSEQCLVIVWLDKSNNYVRIGSLDLATTPLYGADKVLNLPLKVNTTLNNKTKVLWLKEFPAIPIYGASDSIHAGTIHGMVVDKKRSKLFIATTSLEGEQYITSTKFEGHSHGGGAGWSYPTIQYVPTCQDFTGMSGLSIDESRGDWLFYSSRQGQNGDYINAVQQVRDPADMANRALVAYVKADDEQQLASSRSGINLVIDSANRRLYWLTKANELYSSNYFGADIKLIAKLSHKPAIRSIEVMQVVDNTLYLSDSIKRSFIAFKLPKPTTSEIYSSSLDYDANDYMSFGLRRSANEQDDHLIEPTHQVLLVETPTIKGFRVIDLRRLTVLPTTIGSSGEVTQAKIYPSSTPSSSSSDEGQEDACPILCRAYLPGLGAMSNFKPEMVNEYCQLQDRLNLCDPESLMVSSMTACEFGLLLIPFIPPLLLITIYYYVSKRIEKRARSEVPEKIPV